MWDAVLGSLMKRSRREVEGKGQQETTYTEKSENGMIQSCNLCVREGLSWGVKRDVR